MPTGGGYRPVDDDGNVIRDDDYESPFEDPRIDDDIIPEGHTGVVSLEIYEYEEDHPETSWYPNIDFSPTRSGIQYNHTIKIRKIFQSKNRVHGYPVKFSCAPEYFSGLAIWVDLLAAINTYKSTRLWIENHDKAWREVYVGMIVDPNSEYGVLERMIPKVGNYTKYIDEMLWQQSQTLYPIYENLAFKDTMNDKFILANWDKIKQELSYWGY